MRTRSSISGAAGSRSRIATGRGEARGTQPGAVRLDGEPVAPERQARSAARSLMPASGVNGLFSILGADGCFTFSAPTVVFYSRRRRLFSIPGADGCFLFPAPTVVFYSRRRRLFSILGADIYFLFPAPTAVFYSRCRRMFSILGANGCFLFPAPTVLYSRGQWLFSILGAENVSVFYSRRHPWLCRGRVPAGGGLGEWPRQPRGWPRVAKATPSGQDGGRQPPAYGAGGRRGVIERAAGARSQNTFQPLCMRPHQRRRWRVGQRSC